MALKYDRNVIAHMTPYTIQKRFTEKEIRNAYAKFRREFLKRKKEFENSEYKGTNAIQDAIEVFQPTLKKAEILPVVHALHEITKWLNSAESTVEGRRSADAKRIATLQARGFTSIKTKEDLIAFGKFMASVRPYFDAQNPYSEKKTAELYQFAVKNNISIPNIMKNYSFYLHNLDRIYDSDLTVQRGKRKGQRQAKSWTMDRLKKELGGYWDERDTIY